MALNVARKTTLLICVLLIAPIFATPFVHHLWPVVALLGMATAGHQGWSANLFTLPSDMFPKSAVASVIGIGGMMGAVGGVLLPAGSGCDCLCHPQLRRAVHHRVPRLPDGVSSSFMASRPSSRRPGCTRACIRSSRRTEPVILSEVWPAPANGVEGSAVVPCYLCCELRGHYTSLLCQNRIKAAD